MSCSCATFDLDEGRWTCSVSGSQCVFFRPSAKACAEIYGEGPAVQHTPEEENEIIYNWFLYRGCMIATTRKYFEIRGKDNISLFKTEDSEYYQIMIQLIIQNNMDIDGDYRQSLTPSPEQELLDHKLDELLNNDLSEQ